MARPLPASTRIRSRILATSPALRQSHFGRLNSTLHVVSTCIRVRLSRLRVAHLCPIFVMYRRIVSCLRSGTGRVLLSFLLPKRRFYGLYVLLFVLFLSLSLTLCVSLFAPPHYMADNTFGLKPCACSGCCVKLYRPASTDLLHTCHRNTEISNYFLRLVSYNDQCANKVSACKCPSDRSRPTKLKVFHIPS